MEVAWCTPVNTVPSVWGGGGGMGVASKACPWGLDVGQTEQVYISGIAVSWLIIFMCILRPLK